MIKYVVGIDPGQKGGVCILDTSIDLCNIDMDLVTTFSIPLLKTTTYKQDIHQIFSRIAEVVQSPHNMSVAYVEQVHAFPGQGVTSMFSFGWSAGELSGMLKTAKIPTTYVIPQTWKKYILKEYVKRDKEAAIDKVRKLFGNHADEVLDARKWRDKIIYKDGIADAICIALYGLQEVKRVC